MLFITFWWFITIFFIYGTFLFQAPTYHLALEAVLVIWVFWLLFHKSYKPEKQELTERVTFCYVIIYQLIFKYIISIHGKFLRIHWLKVFGFMKIYASRKTSFIYKGYNNVKEILCFFLKKHVRELINLLSIWFFTVHQYFSTHTTSLYSGTSAEAHLSPGETILNMDCQLWDDS